MLNFVIGTEADPVDAGDGNHYRGKSTLFTAEQ